jgi:hypothetical protein
MIYLMSGYQLVALTVGSLMLGIALGYEIFMSALLREADRRASREQKEQR